ncbi:IMP 5'-nucleotidase [Saitoella coloradoensis]
MTTRYRVEYALKSHRRDNFIEWIKGLLAVPFVLHSQPRVNPSPATENDVAWKAPSTDTRSRYAEIFHDIEELVDDHIAHAEQGTVDQSKLKLLVPSVGTFWTKLPLERAFLANEERRAISARRFVAPSFNDVRLTLNSAQLMALVDDLKLITFDGDVTLYNDGGALSPDNPVIPRLIALLRADIHVGILTAAGYEEKNGVKYRERIYGLLDAVAASDLTEEQKKRRLILLGGESNYLLRYSSEAETGLEWVDEEEWQLDVMKALKDEDIHQFLDIAETVLRECIDMMRLPATILRKGKAVGMNPTPGKTLSREQLEEVVLAVQRTLMFAEVSQRIPFCAFNGGADVWVDIGDKRLGVVSLQNWLGGIHGRCTLHVGDQFLSLGHNDFKARLAATTVWIASPSETVEALDEYLELRRRASSCLGLT